MRSDFATWPANLVLSLVLAIGVVASQLAVSADDFIPQVGTSPGMR